MDHRPSRGCKWHDRKHASNTGTLSCFLNLVSPNPPPKSRNQRTRHHSYSSFSAVSRTRPNHRPTSHWFRAVCRPITSLSLRLHCRRSSFITRVLSPSSCRAVPISLDSIVLPYTPHSAASPRRRSNNRRCPRRRVASQIHSADSHWSSQSKTYLILYLL